MEQLTLEQIGAALAFIVGIGGSIGVILKAVKGMLKKLLDEQTKSLVLRLDKIDDRLDKVDMDNCKNYIVQALSAAERGVKLSTEEKIRLAEEFQRYTDGGGNSYIKDWHKRLHDSGMI